MIKRLIMTISIVMLVMMISACARPIETERSDRYFIDMGETYYRDGNYTGAIEAYENALLRAESPAVASEIQLQLANSYFKSHKYKDAIPVYEVYLDIYGYSMQSAMAYMNLGLSYYHMQPGIRYDSIFVVKLYNNIFRPEIKRDSSYLIKARDSMLIATQKDRSLDTEDIQQKLVEINEILAEKELFIASYYKDIRKVDERKRRLANIVSTYYTTKTYPKAMKELVKLLVKEGDIAEATKYYDELRINLPDSKATRDVAKMLDLD